MKVIILFEFYKKHLANKRPNLQRAALPESSKVSTAVNECIRRFKNTSRDLPDSNIEDILKEYMRELRHGGYSHNWRSEVLRSASLGYQKFWELEQKGEGFVNEPCHTTIQKRRADKLEGQNHWFKLQPKLGKVKETLNVRSRPKRKRSKQFQPTESVLFIPFTKDSRLKKTLQEVEKNS